MWNPWPEGASHDWLDTENQSCWYCTLSLYLDPLLAQTPPISVQTIACEILGYHTSVSRLGNSEMWWCCVFWYTSTNISEEYAASNYRKKICMLVPNYHIMQPPVPEAQEEQMARVLFLFSYRRVFKFSQKSVAIWVMQEQKWMLNCSRNT
jgi:hypothetical protein